MPVPTLISQLSTTASLNSPDGAADVPSSIDDYQRAHAAFIAQLYAGTVAAPTVIVPSATTTDIGAAASENVDISGNTTITGFGTVAEGINRKGRFTGVLTLTHNATSLILPGNANITTAANDRYEARSLGGGNWIVTKYQYASGLVRSVDIQNQTVTKFTTSGTSTAFTGAPNPPVTSNTAGQRFTATLHAAPTGPFTLSVSGQPAMNVTYWDTNLASWQIAGAAQAKQWYPCDVVSDGTQWILLNPVPIRTALMAAMPASYNTSATLTNAVMNKLLFYWGAGAGTFTLPAAPSIGDTATISAISTGTCTIARNGSQTIYARGISGATSTSIAPGESISLVFDGTNWVQAAGSLPPSGLGIGQTWQAVTRAPGTTYYNTTGKPIVLSVRAHNNASAAQNVYGYVNGVEVAVDGSSFGGQKFGIDFIIPNGANYSFALSGGNYEYAAELR